MSERLTCWDCRRPLAAPEGGAFALVACRRCKALSYVGRPEARARVVRSAAEQASRGGVAARGAARRGRPAKVA